MKFACSDTVPCSNIVVGNVNLERNDGTVETYCNSAEGFGYGIVHPSADCLSSQDKDCIASDLTERAGAPELEKNRIVHTEL